MIKKTQKENQLFDSVDSNKNLTARINFIVQSDEN